MKKIFLTILFLLLITAGIVFFIYRGVTELDKPKETIKIAKATTDISEGTILNPDMYEYVVINKEDYINSYVTYEDILEEKNGKQIHTTIDPIKGKEVKENIYAGEIIIKPRVRSSSFETDVSDKTNGFRKISIPVKNTSGLSGQVKEGDRVDIWTRYKLKDNESDDSLLVALKVLPNIPVVRALDSNGNEIKNDSASVSSVELYVTESQQANFYLYEDIGKIKIAKVPVGISKEERNKIIMKKISMNELIWRTISMEENEMVFDEILLDEMLLEKLDYYEIENEENEGEE
ncbi:MAG: RcpC/CpaB family pilus assembly protein [Candidatus Woesearchaeota archaeon]